MQEIITDRYILRKVNKEDAHSIFEILSDEQVITNLNMNIHREIEDTYTLIEDYEKGYQEKEKYPYAIIEKETNKFVGVFLIKLDLYDEDCFEFTVYLAKSEWNKGIYTEVLPYMVKVAFEDVQTGNFRGFVMEKNKSSSRVLEKCGFELEKIFEVPGLEGKIISYLITREEYEKTKNK